jgi:hypothetical protein
MTPTHRAPMSYASRRVLTSRIAIGGSSISIRPRDGHTSVLEIFPCDGSWHFRGHGQISLPAGENVPISGPARRPRAGPGEVNGKGGSSDLSGKQRRLESNYIRVLRKSGPPFSNAHNMSTDDIHAVPRGTNVSTPSESKTDIAQDRKGVELAHLEKAVINKDTHFVVD